MTSCWSSRLTGSAFRLYVGCESGNQVILDKIQKGETREEMIAAVKKSEGLGRPTSLTFLSGIGGYVKRGARTL